MKNPLFLIPLVILFSQCRQHTEENYITVFPGKPGVPASIKSEHEYLLAQIDKMALFQDSTGIVAIKLKELMHHHFSEEEDYVLPPLGLLPLLAGGKIPDQGKAVVQLTEKLKTQLTHLSVEHQMIKAYIGELKEAAVKENHPGVIEFEKAVSKHAETEEEVFFPAAILIGEYLKLTSKEKP